MIKFLQVFILLTSAAFAQYTTPNTGVNWNLDDLVTNSGGAVTGSFPNYSVTNSIIISAADKILIAPGTIVSFSGTTSGFEVEGIFSAIGTESDSIIFTSDSADSTGAYDGFRFSDTAVDSECVISYARIEYAYYGMRCIDANPTLQNSYLYMCRRPVQLSGSDAAILNNRIEKAYEYGILINLDSNPLIEGNILAENNTQGTSAKNQISIGLQGNNSPIIRDNVIYGGTGIRTGGISLWVNGETSFSNMVAEGNEIYDNSFGITLYSTSNGLVNALLKNNKIYNNNVNPDALVSGSGINVNGSPFNTPTIVGNEIFGNWWGVTIQNGTTLQAGPVPNLGNIDNADPDDDGGNIIYANVQGSDIYDLYNNCTNDIYAQNNDWRVYDSLSIEGHVYHQADNSAHGLVRFTPFSLFVPVELTSFAASVDEDKVSLKWETATEHSNRGFEILRSKINNQISGDSWEIIGFIEGSGNSTEKRTYFFTDKNLEEGKYRYRLNQIDYDGTNNTFSKIVEVEIVLPKEFELSQNFPNPFNPKTTIKFQIEKDAEVTLRLFNVIGETVKNMLDKFLPAGTHEVTLDASDLQSGVYFYRIDAKEPNGNILSETKKLVLMK